MNEGKTRDAEDAAAAAEVFFDGGCPVCRREIDAYRAMTGGAVAFRDVSDPSVAAAAARETGVAPERLLGRFHVRRADGRLASGAAAFLAVWRAAPPLARFGRLLDRTAIHRLGDVAYGGFLALRRLWRR